MPSPASACFVHKGSQSCLDHSSRTWPSHVAGFTLKADVFEGLTHLLHDTLRGSWHETRKMREEPMWHELANMGTTDKFDRETTAAKRRRHSASSGPRRSRALLQRLKHKKKITSTHFDPC